MIFYLGAIKHAIIALNQQQEVMVDIYLVGGAVRDQLLGRKFKERDWVVVGATPEQMLAKGYKQVGKEFPVFLHPRTKEEYALARKERKTGKGYYGFICDFSPDVTLEEDLMRRDLTINAMARTKSGRLIDPYHGYQDLKNKIMRHVSPAFAEDPVRILRVARFAARFANFKIHSSTLRLMRKLVNDGEIDNLIPERVWQEFDCAITEKNPERFLQTLKHCGALATLFPELNKHINTIIKILRNAKLPKENCERFAIIMHKNSPQTIRKFCKKNKVPRNYCELAELVAKQQPNLKKKKLTATEMLKILEQTDAFRRPERFKQFISVCNISVNKNAAKQLKLLKKAYIITNKITSQKFIQQGLAGANISKAQHKERLTKLQRLM